MAHLFEYIAAGLLLFSIAFTGGTFLLVAFARLCGIMGLIGEEHEGGKLREFLRNFA